MSLIEAFRFRTSTSAIDSEIPTVFPMSLTRDFFVKNDIVNIYAKILTDVVQRTQGISDEIAVSIWDNCLESESKKGLISLLAEAMESKSELYLVYRLGVLRKANQEETEQIKQDYKLRGSSDLGVFVSFRNYLKTDMLRIYSLMEYAVLNSLHKTLNTASALQFKMAKLRESVGAIDSTQIIAQAKSIAKALSCGSDVLMDGNDEIFTSKPEMEPTQKAISFLDAKRSFYLGLPISYITGEQTAGIGSTGEADTKAIERGLKIYFVSIMKPVLIALFGINPSFKSEDFRQMSSALEAVKTFELIGEDLLSSEEKKLIVMKLFDIETKE